MNFRNHCWADVVASKAAVSHRISHTVRRVIFCLEQSILWS